MEIVDSSKPPRRWSKRSLILIVSSLSLGVLSLVVGVVGVARSVSFVLDAVDATANVGQIAPDRATVARKSVAPTPASEASRPPTPSSPNISAAAGTGSTAPPSVVTPAASATQAGGSHGEVAGDGEARPFAGVAGVGGGGSGAGGAAGAGGSQGGSAGAAGATPLFWERFAQSVLALVGQTTISMCGPNTCNVGQVCCNASCGICAAPGATCDQRQCAAAPRAPTNFLCGRSQCNDGQICCNPSCGICVAPGETCSEQQCQ